MAATGQTTNYKLPMYNAGDTVSDLGSFNQAMQLIDTGMEQNRIEGQQNKGLVDALTTQVEKAQGDITALQESVTQANGNAVGALEQIQEILRPVQVVIPGINQNIRVFNGYRSDLYYTGHTIQSSETLTTTLEIPSLNREFFVAGKANNSNPLNLKALSYLTIEAIYYFNSNTPQFKGSITEFLYYDGVNSYILVPVNLEIPEGYTNSTVLTTTPYFGNLQN